MKMNWHKNKTEVIHLSKGEKLLLKVHMPLHDHEQEGCDPYLLWFYSWVCYVSQQLRQGEEEEEENDKWKMYASY